MNASQIKLLAKMKKLITINKRKFAVRKDKDYVEELLELGITETETWGNILSLNANFYYTDPKPYLCKITG